VATRPDSAMKYDVAIDPTAETSHTRVVRLVGHDMRVLDLGCATGKLAELLSAQGCAVTGVERDPEAAKLAEAHCERVVVADLEGDLSALDNVGTFDVIVAADVLEHVTDPKRVLEAVAQHLAPHGYLVTSIPNVAHGSVRLALLAGRFPYSDLGLLDSTHVRFYTRTSMSAMLSEGGFHVAYVEDQLLDAELGEVLQDVDLESLPAEARASVRDDKDSGVYQFIAVSSPRGPKDGLLNALARICDEVVQLEQDRAKADNAVQDVLARHASELAAERASTEEQIHLLSASLAETEDALTAAREETLAARREAIMQNVRDAALADRVQALEAHAAHLSTRESHRLELETQLLRLQAELADVHASKLWKLGTLYRRYVGNALNHR
jgi:2-polyprenyl-3-methyl-5-hydroxy-6-metoxy-1,4-benzoquinol methylase